MLKFVKFVKVEEKILLLVRKYTWGTYALNQYVYSFQELWVSKTLHDFNWMSVLPKYMQGILILYLCLLSQPPGLCENQLHSQIKWQKRQLQEHRSHFSSLAHIFCVISRKEVLYTCILAASPLLNPHLTLQGGGLLKCQHSSQKNALKTYPVFQLLLGSG